MLSETSYACQAQHTHVIWKKLYSSLCHALQAVTERYWLCTCSPCTHEGIFSCCCCCSCWSTSLLWLPRSSILLHSLHGRHKAAHGSYNSACVNASCSLTISLALPHLGKHRPCIALLSSVRKPNVEHQCGAWTPGDFRGISSGPTNPIAVPLGVFEQCA